MNDETQVATEAQETSTVAVNQEAVINANTEQAPLETEVGTVSEETMAATGQANTIEETLEQKADLSVQPTGELSFEESEAVEIKDHVNYSSVPAGITVSPVINPGAEGSPVIGFAFRPMVAFQVRGVKFAAGDYVIIGASQANVINGFTVAEFKDNEYLWDCSKVMRTQLNGVPA